MKIGQKKVATILRTIGEPVRMEILCVLMRKPDVCVSEVAGVLSKSVAIISHHLRELAKVGVLEPVRTGKHICYRISDSPVVSELRQFICKYK
jgi:DNA-binding transcriptional ArsR family regulator